MKKNYAKPDVTVVDFKAEDVITVSTVYPQYSGAGAAWNPGWQAAPSTNVVILD